MDVNPSVLLGSTVGLGLFYHYIPKKFNPIEFELARLPQRQCHKTEFQMKTLLSNPGILEQKSEELKKLLSLNPWLELRQKNFQRRNQASVDFLFVFQAIHGVILFFWGLLKPKLPVVLA